jgi:hypothetical protein
MPRHGVRRVGHGWAATLPPLAGYQMTSEETPVLWPLISGDGLPPWGAEMGYDVLSGGKFYCDPMGWVLNDSIPVTNPNIFIFGKPGRGKSATVKAFMLRMIRYGYRSLVLGDVKDEYEDLARFLDVEPFRNGSGLAGRISPLGLDWERQSREEQHRRATVIVSRWLFLIRGLVGSQGVVFTPTEERVVNKVLRHLTGWSAGASQLKPVTIPQVWAALDTPAGDLVADCRCSSRQDFFDGTRPLRDALGALCEGSLQGMFDAESTFRPDWRAPIQTLSLRSLHETGNKVAVGIALMCLNSWGQGMRETASAGDRRIVLRDEAWLQIIAPSLASAPCRGEHGSRVLVGNEKACRIRWWWFRVGRRASARSPPLAGGPSRRTARPPRRRGSRPWPWPRSASRTARTPRHGRAGRPRPRGRSATSRCR